MEENLEPNTEVNNISDKINKSNSENIQEPKSEKDLNFNENNPNSQNKSAPKLDKKMMILITLKIFPNQ